jgi:hypothetical protein
MLPPLPPSSVLPEPDVKAGTRRLGAIYRLYMIGDMPTIL